MSIRSSVNPSPASTARERSQARAVRGRTSTSRTWLRHRRRQHDRQRTNHSASIPAAEKMPGVLAVFITETLSRCTVQRRAFESESRAGRNRPPFEDDNVYYYGQFVALVIAETFEQGAGRGCQGTVNTTTSKPQVRLSQAPAPGDPPMFEYSRGDAESAFRQAPVKIRPHLHHPGRNPQSDGDARDHRRVEKSKDKLTLYETTQGVVNHHNTASRCSTCRWKTSR